MWQKLLSIGLAFGLLCGPLSALPEQSPPLSSVTLSGEEYAAIEAAITQAREALAKSNETIAAQSLLLTQAENNLKASNQLIQTQSKTLTTLWIFCGVLGAALAIDATAELVSAIKK